MEIRFHNRYFQTPLTSAPRPDNMDQEKNYDDPIYILDSIALNLDAKSNLRAVLEKAVALANSRAKIHRWKIETIRLNIYPDGRVAGQVDIYGRNLRGNYGKSDSGSGRQD